MWVLTNLFSKCTIVVLCSVFFIESDLLGLLSLNFLLFSCVLIIYVDSVSYKVSLALCGCAFLFLSIAANKPGTIKMFSVIIFKVFLGLSLSSFMHVLFIFYVILFSVCLASGVVIV